MNTVLFISKEKFEIGRNFANKIWNASRLVFMNCSDILNRADYEALNLSDLDLPSRWIIASFYDTLAKVSRAIEEFHYSESENLIQDFFWGNYCDWYLELIKSKFNDPNIQNTALFILKNSLKIMHPFIPFVTEEIYSKMNSKDECLSLAAWPKRDENLLDHEASSQMQSIIDVISAIRAIRTQWGIKPNQPIIPEIVPQDKKQEELFKANSSYIMHLARLETLTIDSKVLTTQDAAIALVGTTKIIVPLKGIIDLELEKKRKIEEIAQKQKSIDGLQSRLNNEAFVSKAPEEIIIKEKDRLNDLSLAISELKRDLASLS